MPTQESRGAKPRSEGRTHKGRAVFWLALMLFSSFPAGIVGTAAADVEVFEAPAQAPPRGPPLRVIPSLTLLGQSVELRGTPDRVVVVHGPSRVDSLQLDADGMAPFAPPVAGRYSVLDPLAGDEAHFEVRGPDVLESSVPTPPVGMILPGGSVLVRVHLTPGELAQGDLGMPPAVLTSTGLRLSLAATHSDSGASFAIIVDPAHGVPQSIVGLPGPLAEVPIALERTLPSGELLAEPEIPLADLDLDIFPTAPATSGKIGEILAALDLTPTATGLVADDGTSVVLPKGAHVARIGDETFWIPSGSHEQLDPSLFRLDDIRLLQENGLVPAGSIPVIVKATSRALLPDVELATPALDGALALATMIPPILPDAPDPVALQALSNDLAALGLNARPLPSIGAVATEIPFEALPLLALFPSAERVYLDAPMQARTDTSITEALGATRAAFASEFHVDGAGMRIAVLDTGIDATHGALDDLDDNSGTADPKVALWRVFTGEDCALPCDVDGHGTHVASIAAGTPSGSPYEGMAPGATLLVGKVLHDGGWGLMSEIIEGIEWAVDPDGDPLTSDGAHVISLSLGGSEGTIGLDPGEQAVEAAVAKGIVVVVAGGNSGPSIGTIGSPGSAPSALTVGSYADTTDLVASSSSRGPTLSGIAKPEILAPGVSITAADVGGGHVTFSGTSMATPHVAGAAALFRQAYGTSAEETRGTLIAAASGIADGDGVLATGMGRLHTANAMRSCLLVEDGPANILTSGLANFSLRNRCLTTVTLNATMDDASTTGVNATFTAPATLAPGATGIVRVNVTSTVGDLAVTSVRVNATNLTLRLGVVVRNAVSVHLDGPPASVVAVLDDEARERALFWWPAGTIVLPPLEAGNYSVIAMRAGLPVGFVMRPITIDGASHEIDIDMGILMDPAHHLGLAAREVPLAAPFCEFGAISFSPCSALRFDGPTTEFRFLSIGRSNTSSLVIDIANATWPTARVATPVAATSPFKVFAQSDMGARVSAAMAVVRMSGTTFGLGVPFLTPGTGGHVDMAAQPGPDPWATLAFQDFIQGEVFGPMWATSTGPLAVAPTTTPSIPTAEWRAVGPEVRLGAGPVLPYVGYNGTGFSPVLADGLVRGQVSGPHGGGLHADAWAPVTNGSNVSMEFSWIPIRGSAYGSASVRARIVNDSAPAIVSVTGALLEEHATPLRAVLRAPANGVSLASFVVRTLDWNGTILDETPLAVEGGQASGTIPAYRGSARELLVRAADGSEHATRLRGPMLPAVSVTLTPDTDGGCRPCVATIENRGNWFTYATIHGMAGGASIVPGSATSASLLLPPGATIARPFWFETPAELGPWLAIVQVCTAGCIVESIAMEAPAPARTLSLSSGMARVPAGPGDCAGARALSLDAGSEGIVVGSLCSDLVLTRSIGSRFRVQGFQMSLGSIPGAVTTPVVVDVPAGAGPTITGLQLGTLDSDGDLVSDSLVLRGSVENAPSGIPLHACAGLAAHDVDVGSVACAELHGTSLAINFGGIPNGGNVDIEGFFGSWDTLYGGFSLLDASVTGACCPSSAGPTLSVRGIDVDGDGAPGWANATFAFDRPLPNGMRGLFVSWAAQGDSANATISDRNASAILLGRAVDGGTVSAMLDLFGQTSFLSVEAPYIGSERVADIDPPQFNGYGLSLESWMNVSSELESVRYDTTLWGPNGTSNIASVVGPTNGPTSFQQTLTANETAAAFGRVTESASALYLSTGSMCAPAAAGGHCAPAPWRWDTEWVAQLPQIRPTVVQASFVDTDSNGRPDSIDVAADVATDLTMVQGGWCAIVGSHSLGCHDFATFRGPVSTVQDRFPLLGGAPRSGDTVEIVAWQGAFWESNRAPVASEPFALVVPENVEAAMLLQGARVTTRDVTADGVTDAVNVDVDLALRVDMPMEIYTYVNAYDRVNGDYLWSMSGSNFTGELGTGNVSTRIVLFVPQNSTTAVDLHAVVYAYALPGFTSVSLGTVRANATAVSTQRAAGPVVRVVGVDGWGANSTAPTMGRVEVDAIGAPGLTVRGSCNYFASTLNVSINGACDWRRPLNTTLPAEWWLNGGGWAYINVDTCFEGSCQWQYFSQQTHLAGATPFAPSNEWTIQALDVDSNGDNETLQASASHAAQGSVFVAACIGTFSFASYTGSSQCEPEHAASDPGWGDVGPRLMLGSASGNVSVWKTLQVCSSADCRTRTNLRLGNDIAALGAPTPGFSVDVVSTAPLDLDNDGAADAALVTANIQLLPGHSSVRVDDAGSTLLLPAEDPDASVQRILVAGSGAPFDRICAATRDHAVPWESYTCGARLSDLSLEPLFGDLTATLVDADADGLAEALDLDLHATLPPDLGLGGLTGFAHYGPWTDSSYKPVSNGSQLLTRVPLMHDAGASTLLARASVFACIAPAMKPCFVVERTANVALAGAEPGFLLTFDLSDVDTNANGITDELRAEGSWSSTLGGAPSYACLDQCFFDASVANATGIRMTSRFDPYAIRWPHFQTRSLQLGWSAPNDTYLHLSRMASTFIVPSAWESAMVDFRIGNVTLQDIDSNGKNDTIEIDVTKNDSVYTSAYIRQVWRGPDYVSIGSQSPNCGGTWAWANENAAKLRLALDPVVLCPDDRAEVVVGGGSESRGEVRLLPNGTVRTLCCAWSEETVSVPITNAETTLRVTNATHTVVDGWITAQADVAGFQLNTTGLEVWGPEWAPGVDQSVSMSLGLSNGTSEPNATIELSGPVLSDSRMRAYGHRWNMGGSSVSHPVANITSTLGRALPIRANAMGGDLIVGVPLNATWAVNVTSHDGCTSIVRGPRMAANCTDRSEQSPPPSGMLVGNLINGSEARALIGDAESSARALMNSYTSFRTSTAHGWANVWTQSNAFLPVTVNGSLLRLPSHADASEPDARTAATAIAMNATILRGLHGYDDRDWFRASAPGSLLACPDAHTLGLLIATNSTNATGVRCTHASVEADEVASIRSTDPWTYGATATYSVSLLPPGSILEPVTVRLPHVTVPLNASADAEISLIDVTSLGGIDLNVTFDPSVVHVDAVVPGLPNNSTTITIDNTTGVVRLVANGTGDPGPGDHTLATLRLRGVGANGAVSSLTPSVGMLVDANGTNTPTILRSGSATITGVNGLASLFVRVVDAANDTPIAGARVNVSGNSSLNGATTPSGFANFTNVTPGNYAVSASAGLAYSRADANVTILAGEQTSVTLRLTHVANASLVGTILDAIDNVPVQGALVGLSGPNASGSRTTGADGRFAFDGLEAGLHTISASREGYQTATSAFALDIGQTLDTQILLTPDRADYAVSGVSYTPAAPSSVRPIHLYANVTNSGQTAATTGSRLAAYEGTTLLGSISIPPLGVGTTYAAYVTSVSLPTVGDHVIRFVADSAGNVREINESNNERNVTIHVLAPPPSDLLVRSASMWPSSIIEDEETSFWASVEVENAGEAADAFWLNATSNGSTLASRRAYNAPAATTQWMYLNGVIPASATRGARSILVNFTADPAAEINETNETNNSRQIEIDIVPFNMTKQPSYPEILRGTEIYAGQPNHGYVYYRANGSAVVWANLTMDPGLVPAYGTLRSREIRSYDSDWNFFSFWVEGAKPGTHWVNLTLESHGIQLSWNSTYELTTPLVVVKTLNATSGSAPYARNLSYQVFDFPSAAVYNGSNALQITLEGGSEGRIVTGLDNLLQYPYGCVEQTTSATRASFFSQLYYHERGALTAELNTTLSNYVEAGMRSLQTGERKPTAYDLGWNQWSDQSSPAETFFTLYPLGLLHAARADATGWYLDNVNDGVMVNATRWIVANQSADGGWEKKSYGYIQTNVTLTTMALDDLTRSNAAFTNATLVALSGGALTKDQLNLSIARARTYLVNAQRSDGGWGLAPNDTTANSYTTARAIIALAPYGEGNATIASAIANGTSWLASHQNVDGSWNSNPEHSGWMWGRAAISESTGQALLALNLTTSDSVFRNNTNNASMARGYAYLLGAFETGGGWGSTKATGTVIEALTRMSSQVLDAYVDLNVTTTQGTYSLGRYHLTNLDPARTLNFEHHSNGSSRLTGTDLWIPRLLEASAPSIEVRVSGTGTVGVKAATSQHVPLDEAQADDAIRPHIDPIATNFTAYAQTPDVVTQDEPFVLTLSMQNLQSTALQTPMIFVNLTDDFEFVNTTAGGVTGLVTVAAPDRYGFNLAKPGGGIVYGEYNRTQKRLYVFPDFVPAEANLTVNVTLLPRAFGSKTLEVTGTLMYDDTTIWPHARSFRVLGRGTIDVAAGGADAYTIDGTVATTTHSVVEGAHWVNATAPGKLPSTMRILVDPATDLDVRFAPTIASALAQPHVLAWTAATAPQIGTPIFTAQGTTVTLTGTGQVAVRIALPAGQIATGATADGVAIPYLAGSGGGLQWVDAYATIDQTATIRVLSASPRASASLALYPSTTATSPIDSGLDAGIDLTSVYMRSDATTTRFAWQVRGDSTLNKTYQVQFDRTGDLVADSWLNVSLLGTGYFDNGVLQTAPIDMALDGRVVEAAIATSALGAPGASIRFRAIGSFDETPWLTGEPGATAIAWSVPTPSQGAAVPLSVTVRNFGPVATGTLSVSLLVAGQPSGAASATLGSIAPGESSIATISWTPATAGTFALAARVTGAVANASGTLASIAVSAPDTVAPIVTGGEPTGTITGALPIIRAAWSDVGSGIASASAAIVVDGTNVTSSATLSTTGFAYTPTNALVTGTHTVQASVGDLAGNRGSASWTFTVPSASSTPPPTSFPPASTTSTSTTTTTTNVTSGNGTTVAPGVASNRTLLTVAARLNATLAAPFVANDTDGDGVRDAFVDPNGALRSHAATSLGELRAFLIGGVNASKPAFLWIADNDTLIELDLPEPTGFTAAFDPATGSETVTVHVAKGMWIWFQVPDAHPGSPVEVRAADGRVMGADRIWRANGTISVLDDPDTTYAFTYSEAAEIAPTASILSPTAGSTQTGRFEVVVDASSARGITKVELFVGGKKVGERTSTPYVFALDAAEHPVGSLMIVARATDASGRLVEAETFVQIAKGTITTPSIELEIPTKLRGVVTLKPTFRELDMLTRVDYFVDGAIVGTATSGPWSHDLDTGAIAPGKHTLRILATDATGRTVERTWDVEVVESESAAPPEKAGRIPGALSLLAIAGIAIAAAAMRARRRDR